jgi:hypothetical protein
VLIFKIAILSISWIIYIVFLRVFYPVITIKPVLRQFENTSQSFTDLALYQLIVDYLWILPIVITLCVFRKEIKILYYKLKGGL